MDAFLGIIPDAVLVIYEWVMYIISVISTYFYGDDPNEEETE